MILGGQLGGREQTALLAREIPASVPVSRKEMPRDLPKRQICPSGARQHYIHLSWTLSSVVERRIFTPLDLCAISSVVERCIFTPLEIMHP